MRSSRLIKLQSFPLQNNVKVQYQEIYILTVLQNWSQRHPERSKVILCCCICFVLGNFFLRMFGPVRHFVYRGPYVQGCLVVYFVYRGPCVKGCLVVYFVYGGPCVKGCLVVCFVYSGPCVKGCLVVCFVYRGPCVKGCLVLCFVT